MTDQPTFARAIEILGGATAAAARIQNYSYALIRKLVAGDRTLRPEHCQAAAAALRGLANDAIAIADALDPPPPPPAPGSGAARLLNSLEQRSRDRRGRRASLAKPDDGARLAYLRAWLEDNHGGRNTYQIETVKAEIAKLEKQTGDEE